VSIQTRTEILELLDRHGLAPSKVLGQHFLADPNLIRKIVATAGVGPGDLVVEIGAGTGTLTAALAESGASIVSYEVDRRLEPLHRDVLGGLANVEVRYADATRVDLGAELGPGPWRLVANLPYNVGTPLLLDILRRVPAVERMVVMVQREVADRLAAAPGSRIYGLPSVVAQIHGQVRLAFRVPPQVFIPPPAVQSAVVSIERIPAPPGAERAIELAARAFGQRRKMIRTSLALPADQILRAGLVLTARAEELTPSDYLRLAQVSDG
jgi:16S rRNA (adenine1518-N6/adenine1519-N6)-dimethyltransferase